MIKTYGLCRQTERLTAGDRLVVSCLVCLLSVLRSTLARAGGRHSCNDGIPNDQPKKRRKLLPLVAEMQSSASSMDALVVEQRSTTEAVERLAAAVERQVQVARERNQLEEDRN